MPAASSASNVFFSDDLPEASGSNYQLLHKLSPVLKSSQLSQTSSQRRGVVWSEQIDNVKLFYKSDSIHPSPESPSKSGPPPSIRSYLHEQDLNAQSTPTFSRLITKYTSSPLSASSSSPSIPRSILKPRVSEIRVAASVEEGGWLNKEPARLLVCGRRPRLVARDSFQLAKMREAAVETTGKGKGKAREEPEEVEKERESEEEEEVIEEGGALMTASLVDIILNGAEDLLTLEEAYTTLTIRLRAKLSSESATSDIATGLDEAIRIAIHPVREEAPAIIRALQRDLGRLLGKVRSTDRESSPFHALRLLEDTPPTDSPKRRQGYTEAEIRYRREAAGVGHAALKFIAMMFRAPQLFDCFSDADLATLLDQVMIIPRTPKLPTLHPKRSYRWSMHILSQMRIPDIAVGPAADKIVSTVEAAMTNSLVPSGALKRGKEDEEIRKEGVRAAINIASNYPSLFLQHYATLLPPAIKGMYDAVPETRSASAAVCAAFAAAKINIQTSTTSALVRDKTASAKQEWQKARTLVQKMEFWVVAHLKIGVKDTGPVAERKSHTAHLLRILKETLSNPDGALWSCAAWSVLVSLMGGTYATGGLAQALHSGPNGGQFDYVMDITANANRPLLARTAWNHAIHGYLLQSVTSTVTAENQLIRSYSPFQSPEANQRLELLQQPVRVALAAANDPESVVKGVYTLPDSANQRYRWERNEKGKHRPNCIVTLGSAASAIIYAYSGMALYHQESDLSISDPTSWLDETWQKLVKPTLAGLLVVKGLDSLPILGWQILLAITSPVPAISRWSLDTLLSARYLNGFAFGVGVQEIPIADFMFYLEGDAIKPAEIPAWGAEWVIKHLAELLDMFQEVMASVQGVDSVDSCGWARTSTGDVVIPVFVMRIWGNLLKALASIKEEEPEAFAEGVQLVVSRMLAISELDPAAYLPIRATGPAGCAQSTDETRLALLSRLLGLAIDALGKDTIGQLAIIRPGASSSPSLAFGSGDRVTPAAFLLQTFLHSSSLSPCLSAAARDTFSDIISKLLDSSQSSPDHEHLLVRISDALPSLFEQDELVQLDIWRLLARSWRQLSSSPSSHVNAGESARIALLVAPFRNNNMASMWHAQTSDQNLVAWRELLDVAVETGAKGLDEVAKQLNAVFASDTEASMIPRMVLAPTEPSHIPIELLNLISLALSTSYAHLESAPEVEVSPGVTLVLKALISTYSSAPSWSASQLLASSATAGVYKWLIHSPEAPLCTALDELYLSIVDLLSRAITSDDIPAATETLDTYLPLYAGRLSHADAPACLNRFKRFWAEHFADLELEYSADVRELLLGVMAAIPGFITVKGLEQTERMSEEESQRRFPHSQGLVNEPLVPASDPTAEVSGEQPTEYDADISTSFGQPINDTLATQQLGSPIDVESLPPSSPLRIEGSSEIAEEPTRSDDVFGPASMVGARKRARRPSKSRAIGATQSFPEVSSKRVKLDRRESESLQPSKTIIPDSQDDAEKTEEDEDDVEVVDKSVGDKGKGKAVEKSASAPSIINRLISKATSFTFFSSPSRRKEEAAFEIIPETDFYARTSSKRVRDESTHRSSSSSKKSRSSRDKPRSERGSSRSSSASGSANSDAIVVSDDDNADEDEDEAAPPTPNTAKRQRAEKEAHGGILHKSKLRAPTPQKSKSSKKTKIEVFIPTQGRFDDATEESIRIIQQQEPQPLPNASPMRTTQQARVLSMVEEAAKAKAAVEGLDFDGVMSLLKYANELRDAATANLQARAMRERGARR